MLGVKTTLNKLAVKLELAWQAFRDFDSINRTAFAMEKGDQILKEVMNVTVITGFFPLKKTKKILRTA